MTSHKAIDYTSKADVYFLPHGGAFKAQTPDWLDIPLADAIRRVLKLPEDEQERISIAIAERGPIDIEEAKAIAQREDFPRK
jgi:hypothetical protein